MVSWNHVLFSISRMDDANLIDDDVHLLTVLILQHHNVQEEDPGHSVQIAQVRVRFVLSTKII